MKSHAIILFYIFVALVGSIALIVSILGTLRSRIRSYWLLVLFYGGFTLLILLAFIRNYLFINMGTLSIDMAITLVVSSTIVTTAFMTSITLYHHRLYFNRFRKPADWIVLGYNTLSIILFVLPGSLVLDMKAGTWRLSPVAQTAQIMYVAQFVYLVVLTLFGSKKDRPVRELVLIWSMFAFVTVGLIENFMSTFQQLKNPIVNLFPDSAGLIISSIPYLLFGGILIYYFGSYVLADRLGGSSFQERVAEQYKLSPREQEVIPLLNMGLSNREIAEKLHVSLATIKTHLHNIYEKTGTKSRYDLFRLTNVREK